MINILKKGMECACNKGIAIAIPEKYEATVFKQW